MRICFSSVQIKNIYAIPKWVKGLLKEKAPIGACTFKEKITPDTENVAAVMVDTLEESLGSMEQYSEKCYFEHQWSKNTDGDFVLTFNIINYNEDKPQVDDDVMAKIEQAITASFADAEFYHDDSDMGGYEEGNNKMMSAENDIAG